jgi:hypothetical protein
MTTYVPCKRGVEYITYTALPSQADPNLFQVNPTLAAGDVKISKDGGALANLTTLPSVSPAGSALVKITVSNTETDCDQFAILFSDAAGAEWCDQVIPVATTATQIDNLVRSTTPANTLDVEATGCAGVDWGNVTGVGASVVLSKTTVNEVTSDVSIKQASADKVWLSVARSLTAVVGVKKGTDLNGFVFPMRDETTKALKTGLAVTAKRSLDAGAFGACLNGVSEIGLGFYAIDLDKTDLAGDVVALLFTAAGAEPTTLTIRAST